MEFTWLNESQDIVLSRLFQNNIRDEIVTQTSNTSVASKSENIGQAPGLVGNVT
jgi:hypothetical protein